MRVLIASRRGSSGIRTYTDELSRGLAEGGHDVVLLDETVSSDESRDLTSSGARIVGVGTGAAGGPSRRVPGAAARSRRAEVARIAREVRADVVHVTHLDLAPRFDRLVVTAWDPLPGPIARARVAGQRGTRRASEAGSALVDAKACRRSSAIIAVTPEVATGLRPFRRPLHVVPPFLPDARVRPASSRGRDVVVIAHGLDGARKGLDLAIAAVEVVRRERPEVQLDLIGRWWDEQRQADLPAFCRVLGPLTRDEIDQRLPGYGCALIPSLWEEFGYAGLEALAAGIPLATAPLPAFRSMSGGGVFRAEERTPQDVGAQVSRALSATSFDFPAECLSSRAIGRIVEAYG